jgi:hypothetical protein
MFLKFGQSSTRMVSREGKSLSLQMLLIFLTSVNTVDLIFIRSVVIATLETLLCDRRARDPSRSDSSLVGESDSGVGDRRRQRRRWWQSQGIVSGALGSRLGLGTVDGAGGGEGKGSASEEIWGVEAFQGVGAMGDRRWAAVRWCSEVVAVPPQPREGGGGGEAIRGAEEEDEPGGELSGERRRRRSPEGALARKKMGGGHVIAHVIGATLATLVNLLMRLLSESQPCSCIIPLSCCSSER